MIPKIITIFLAVCAFGEVRSLALNEDDRLKDLWVSDAPNNVCETDYCKAVATEFKAAMNTSVNPCDDFYEFTCGNWKVNRPIPEDSASWTRLAYFQRIVYQRIRGILAEEPEPEDILPVRQAKKWYRSCMDTDKLERRGLQPLESILLQLGSWPMTVDAEEWDEDDHAWQTIEQHYFQITHSFIFFDFDFWMGNITLIELLKGSLPMIDKLPFQFEDYTGEEYNNYNDLITAVALLFIEHNSANVPLETLDKEIHDMIEFEKQLSEIPKVGTQGVIPVEHFEVYYNDHTEDQGNLIDVRNLIRKVAEVVDLDPASIKQISVDNIDYFVQLNELMNKTPKRTIVNYMHWHFVSQMLTATTETMRELFFALMKNSFDIKSREPRWLECTKEVKMTHAIAYAFSHKYYNEEIERNVREMVDNIKVEMKDQIEASNWLDDDTKSMTTNKLSTMQLYVGTPDWFKNGTYVLNSYRGLSIGVNHFDNVLSFKRYEVRMLIRDKLSGGKVIKAEIIDPLEVNAAYDQDGNAMLLPAADFQPPFFTKNLPHHVNYGMSGTVIGHEIGHAYDINGITKGIKEGEKNVSKEIMDMYLQRAECFLDQFDKYYGVTEPPTSDGEESLGRKTRGENMADTTGVNAVYEAYKTLLQSNGADKKLPGFEQYTDDQMFFISFASLWCTHSTEKYEEARKASDEHSPGDLRVLGAVSNSEDFARAFNCPVGSAMNPHKKCNIWAD